MFSYRIESTDYLKDEETFRKWYYHVPFYRHAKIDALKRDEDKRLSLGAEVLLEQLLRENGFADMAENRVGYYTILGKPYILRPGQTPGENVVPPVHFSISHSRNYVMCALSDTTIGCDLEHADISNTNCNALAARFFGPREARAVEEDNSIFYHLWTLKEAYTKCTQTPLPLVLRMDMDEAMSKVQPDGKKLKKLQGEQDGYIWSVVFNG